MYFPNEWVYIGTMLTVGFTHSCFVLVRCSVRRSFVCYQCSCFEWEVYVVETCWHLTPDARWGWPWGEDWCYDLCVATGCCCFIIIKFYSLNFIVLISFRSFRLKILFCVCVIVCVCVCVCVLVDHLHDVDCASHHAIHLCIVLFAILDVCYY